MKITNNEVKILRFLVALLLLSPSLQFLSNEIGLPYNDIELLASFNQLNWLRTIVCLLSIITSYKTLLITSTSISLVEDNFVYAKSRYSVFYTTCYVTILLLFNPITRFQITPNTEMFINLLIGIFFLKDFFIKVINSFKIKAPL